MGPSNHCSSQLSEGSLLEVPRKSALPAGSCSYASSHLLSGHGPTLVNVNLILLVT